MTRCRLIAGLILCATASSGVANAQAPSPATLTLSLDEAISRAIATSHLIDESRARGDAAASVAGQRRASLLPQIAGQAGYTRTNHVEEFGVPGPNNQFRVIYPDIPDNYRTRVDVQWPLYTSGRLNSLEAAARLDQTAATHDIETTTIDVRLDVTRAFWSVIVAAESQRVVDEALAQTAEHVRDVRNRYEAGFLPPNDVLTAEAQEARERVLSIQARTTREVAEADLARRIGAEPGTRIVPAATLEPPVVDAGLTALVVEAQQHRPERLALDQRIAAAEQRQRAASAGMRPTVGVGGGVDYARPNPKIFPRSGSWQDSWDASVNVNWPLFDGGKTRSETAEAAAGVRALKARLAELDSVIALDIRQRLSELEASRAQLDAAEAGLRAATEARRVVGERFSAGVAASIDVVDAQVAILQAELDRVQAIASGRIAEARLNRALGR
jgi:outer membrane protein TolC